jgi:hypothetical protein
VAQVPRLISQAQVSNLPSVRLQNFATEEALGGGVGKALKAAADDAMQTADAVAVMDAERKARDRRLDLLFNPEKGAYNTKGKDALGLASSVTAELGKSIGEIENTLSTPKQKALFRQRSASMIPETAAELNRYGIEQAKQYESAAIKAYKATAANEAVTYYKNPIRIQESVRKVWDANLLEYKDQPADVLELANKTDQSEIYTATTARLIDDNPLAAQAFYEQNRDLFMGSDQARIERMLEPKVKQYKAFEKANAIIDSTDSTKEWRAQARQIQDQDEQQIVMARLREEEALREREQKALEEKTRDAAWNSVFEGGSLRTMPAAVLANLDPTDRKQILAFEQGRAEGKEVATDWAVYEDLQQLPNAELLQTDLSKYYGQLNETERKELIKKKANVQKGTTQIKPELTFEQQFTDTAAGMLFPASAKDKGLSRQQKEVMGRVRSAAAAEVTRQETQKSGFLTMEERQKIIDREVMAEWRKLQNVEVKRGGLFDEKVPIAELSPDEWRNIDFDDTDLPPVESIPLSSQNAIKAYANSIGVTMTAEQMQRVYLLSQVNAPDEVIEAVIRGKQ